MDNKAHTSFKADDRSYFAILKREIHSIAIQAGFTGSRVGEIDIIVSELASNLVKHAGGGEILARIVSDNNIEALELISIDNGPGMAEPSKMILDGMSTSNTLGQGFGAIKRLSDTFQVYSLKDWGTIVLARVYKKTLLPFAQKPAAEVRSIVVAKPGEIISGDGAYYSLDANSLKIFLGDGLGHGPEAHLAVKQAIAAIRAEISDIPNEILRRIHTDVKKTRGLVGTVAVYHFKEKKWQICGVGNIATRIQQNTATRNHMSYNGVLGMNMPNTLKEQEIEHERGQVLIMCSDGIKTRWDLQKHHGIFKYDLTILAAAVYKDFARKTDDMSVIACRINITS